MSAMSGEEFWGLLQHILPFFIILFPAYFMARRNIITAVHAPGLNRWTSLIGVPIYVGHMVAFTDPYDTNLRLVGADALQKAVVLIIGFAWWRFSPNASIDGVITFFMLATLSNMILVAPTLFKPLHGSISEVSIATIILLQCLLWYNLCIALFEIRNVLKEMKGEDLAIVTRRAEAVVLDHRRQPSNLPGLPFWTSPGPELFDNDEDARSVTRSVSAPTRVSFSTARRDRVVPVFVEDKSEEDICCSEILERSKELHPMDIKITLDVPGSAVTKTIAKENGNQPNRSTSAGGQGATPTDLPRSKYIKIVLFKFLHKVKYAPLVYTSTLGFVYSLVASKYHFEMPYSIRTSLELVAQGEIAVSIVTIALTWHASGRVIAACGYKRMFYGWIIRFVVGPLIMVLASLAFGLREISLEFSVLQAALPVGLESFVLASEYNLDVEVFSTAVITQLIIFLPIVVIYYLVLQVAE